MEENQSGKGISFESLDILIKRWKDGTFSEIIDDWKWIFSYSKRYKSAIISIRCLVYSVHPWGL